MILRLALRNAHRDLRRSLLTGGMIACCVGLMLVGITWVDGAMDMIVRNLLEEHGHVRVVHEDYLRKERMVTLRATVADAPALAATLRTLPEVSSCSERIKFGAMIDLGGTVQEAGLVHAVDPALEAGFPPISSDLVEGRAPAAGEEIVLGSFMARRLGAKLGDTVTLVTNDLHGSLRGQNARVVGLFDRGAKLQNRGAVVSLALARRFLDMEGLATELVLFGAAGRMNELKQPVSTALSDRKELRVQDWQEASGLGPVMFMVGKFMAVIALILGTLAGLGVLNTMLMAVLERTPEIGLLAAMGLRPRRILALFLVEAMVLGIVGGSLGALVGYGGSYVMATRGIAIDSRELEGIPMAIPDRMRSKLSTGAVVQAWMLGVTVAVLASFWPAWVASHMDPVRALRKL